MAVSVVQRNAGSDVAGSTGSITVAFGSNNTAGNTIIAIVTGSDSSSALFLSEFTDVTDTKLNTYGTSKFAQWDATSSTGVKVYVANNIAAGANSVKVPSDTNNPGSLFIYEVSGLDTSAPFDQSVFTAIATGTNYTSGATGTTAVAAELLLGVSVNASTATFTAGGSYTNIQNQSGVSGANAAVDEQIVAATGTYTSVMTATASVSGFAAIFTFKGATVAAVAGTVIGTFRPGATWVRRFAKAERHPYFNAAASVPVVNASITQVAANLTFAGGIQVVSAIQDAAVAQVAATLTFTGGTQAIATVNKVAIAQVAGTLTFTGGTQAIATVNNVSITQAAGTITFAGGTQVVVTTQSASITQSAATITFAGGTQVVQSNATIAQSAATITFNGGTQTIATVNNVSLAQSAGTITFAGGTQSAGGFVSTSVSQVAGSLTFTGGTQTLAAQIAAAIAQLAGSLTFTGGTQAIIFNAPPAFVKLRAILSGENDARDLSDARNDSILKGEANTKTLSDSTNSTVLSTSSVNKDI